MNSKNAALACVALSLISALVYFLLIFGAIHAGNISAGEDAPSFFIIVPIFYVVGGLLILVKKRWLLITGAIFNAIPIIGFYAMYAARPDVMWSFPGIASKAAQILLEIGLIYLIATCKRRKTAA
jgi:hypothetical protein